ncbi:MAG: NUDIX domain-containing protein [Parachlamydiaceae bacterium]|nr:MAG: NUDIX domain-containing protein [Parachlamydiaceae bacterium]
MRANAAIGLVLNEDGSQILLVKRQDVPVWVLPGGGIDEGESSQEAVVREIFEETGLKVHIKRKTAEYTPLNRLAKFTEIFECYAIEGELQKGEETREIGFFPLHKLPKNVFPIHKAWMEEAFKNPHTIIRRRLTEVTYWNLVKYFFKHPVWVVSFLYFSKMPK